MKVLVIGGTGLLGGALERCWRGRDVRLVGYPEVDVRQQQSVDALIQSERPDWTLLAAAYTDVDGAESQSDLAYAVNATGAANVAQACVRTGCRVMYVSTDYVFDGTKLAAYEVDDPKCPINVYGASKSAGEDEILRIAREDSCVVRTAWLFGIGGKCFPDTILRAAAVKDELEVVADQRGCPTLTDDLASAIWALMEAGAHGIVHVTNAGSCTWFQFASEIVRSAGLSTRVTPTTSENFVRPAKRPANSVLSHVHLNSFGIEMRTWQEAVADYLRQKLNLNALAAAGRLQP